LQPTIAHIPRTLVARLRSGDETALKTILDLLGPKIGNYCRRQGMDPRDAEELLQDTFLKLWQYREKLDLSANFEAFVFTIVRNSILNLSRRKLGYELTPTGNLEENAIAPAAWDTYRISYQELVRSYLNILEQRGDKSREVFRLSREEGLSHKQIAEKLNISVRTVEFHISGTLKVLRTELKGSYILLALFLFR